jgi:Rod binding domain-containing protein
MNIPAINSVRPDTALAPERLLGAEQMPESQKIEELSRQFEAVLLRKVLSEAQKPMLGDSLMGGSSTTAIYQDLMVAQLADQIASANTLGLANALKQQLGTKDPDKKPEPSTIGTNPHDNQ